MDEEHRTLNCLFVVNIEFMIKNEFIEFSDFLKIGKDYLIKRAIHCKIFFQGTIAVVNVNETALIFPFHLSCKRLNAPLCSTPNKYVKLLLQLRNKIHRKYLYQMMRL